MKNDSFGDGYLRAEDLICNGKWCRQTYTVTAAHPPGTIKSADGKMIDKDILEFAETHKHLVVGPLNWRLIRYATGVGSKNEIIGKQITLYPSKGNWFGQRNVAALRVSIPDGNYRPFIKAANLGEDITGKEFRVPKVAAPARTPGEQINDCKTQADLHALIGRWLKARPAETNKDSWTGILPLVDIKLDAAKWKPEEAFGAMLTDIQSKTSNDETGVIY